MRKMSVNPIASLTLLLLLLPTWLGAQQIPQNRKWVAENPKFVAFSSAGIHFLSRNAKEGSDSVTTRFHLLADQPWKVAFDVQMVPTANGGMSIHLKHGATELCWLGAGDYYKSISGFLGTGNGNMPFDQHWDNAWHSFSYESDGKTLSLWHNGNKCGETALADTLDTVTIQSIGMELRVRNVSIKTFSPNVEAARSLPKPVEIADSYFKSHQWNQAIEEYKQAIEAGLPFGPATSRGTSGYGKRQISRCHEYKGFAAKDIADYNTSFIELQTAIAVDPTNYEAKALLKELKQKLRAAAYAKQLASENAGTIYPLASTDRNKNTSAPGADLKRFADDYILQVTRILLDKKIVIAAYQVAIDGDSQKYSDEAKSEGKDYEQHLRDLVTEFAQLRAMSGYAEHYIETGWVFDKGDTEDIPGVVGLKNITVR